MRVKVNIEIQVLIILSINIFQGQKMGKNGIPEQQKFNYGKHREKYQKEIFQLIEDIKNIPNDKKSEEINNYFVIKLYTLLKNFGIYKDYDICLGAIDIARFLVKIKQVFLII